MQVYGSIMPGGATIARLLPQLASETKSGSARALSKAARDRLKRIRWYEEHGRHVRLTCRHFGISSSTFYKWLRRYQRVGTSGLEEQSRRPQRVRQTSWGHELVQAVRQLRERHPRWGKDKLAPMLRAAGWECSTSKVGRIVAALKKQGVLVEAPLKDPWRVSHPHKRPHAVRKPRDYTVRAPGDLLQVDTADIRPLPGVIRKHFTARDVFSRWDVLDVYFQATACAAAEFLEVLIARAPFTIRAIQIDGGSEFKADFELLCQQRGIRLFVLPPRSPKLNGSVERAQRTHKEEFYNVIDWPDSITELRRLLRRQEIVYNTIRPHQALGYLTPLAFLQRHYKQKTDRDPVATARLPFYTQHLSTERRPGVA